MAIVNNAYKLGNGSSNIVLDTAGKIYVKVADRYYELNFRDSNTGSSTTIIQNINNNTESVDTSDLVSKDYLKASLADYFTKRDWADVMETQNLLQNSLLEGFTEAISPITVNTMQAVVGNSQLQYEFIYSFTDDTVQFKIPYIVDDELICPAGYIKHYTLEGPSAVQPEENGSNLKQYCRWKISDTESSAELADTRINLVNDDIGYYLYIVVEKISWSQSSVDSRDSLYAKTGIYAKTGNGYYLLSDTAKALDEGDGNYYLLYAIINSKQNGSRSIATMNGFTEILPGQITAYIFKTKEGDQYLDFLDKKFHIGHSPNVTNGTYMHWDEDNGLVVKGNISVVGGELKDNLDSIWTNIGNFGDKFNIIDGEIDDINNDIGSINSNIGSVNDKIDELYYLKKALKGRTDLVGGLLLTNYIQLGFSLGDVDNLEDYYSKFTVMSGINGIAAKNNGIYSLNDVAAWYGGPMVDKENPNATLVPYFIDSHNVKCTYYNSYTKNNTTYYRWIRAINGDCVRTANNPPLLGESIDILNNTSSTDIAVSNMGTVIFTTRGFASSIFRMNGTGYLADGNISWDSEGHLTLQNISVIESAQIGPFIVDNDSVEVRSGDHSIFRVDNKSCSIFGSLTAQSESHWDHASIVVLGPDKKPVVDIGASPLSTSTMSTYIRSSTKVTLEDKKGSMMGGTVTVPNNYYRNITNEYAPNFSGTYSINRIKIGYNLAKVSKTITMKLILREKLTPTYSRDYTIFSHSWTPTDSTYSGTLDLTPSRMNVSSIDVTPGSEYSILFHLLPGGQVKSGAASNSHIKFYNEGYEIEISKSNSSPDIGTFIHSNGISSAFGDNCKMQWMGAMYKNYNLVEDFRSQGGTFLVELPSTSDGTSSVGLHMNGYYDANGDTSAGSGIWINLGGGWKKLKIDGDTLKIEV